MEKRITVNFDNRGMTSNTKGMDCNDLLMAIAFLQLQLAKTTGTDIETIAKDVATRTNALSSKLEQITEEEYEKEMLEIQNKPELSIKTNTKVLVWIDEGGEKYERYFKRFDSDGKIVCFTGGVTDWDSDGGETKWNYWELVK